MRNNEHDILLKDIKKEIESFKIFLMGIIVGVIGGLWSNIIHDLLKNFVLQYLFTVTLITLIAFYFIFKYIANRIDKQMMGSKFNYIWKKMKKDHILK